MIAYRNVWCLLVILNCVFADIDSEYILGNILRERPKELTCDNEALRLYCESRCGADHACLFGKCFCLQNEHDDIEKETLQKLHNAGDRFLDFDDYQDSPHLMRADTYPKRPALRHHIAHFCPNLEVARQCIRTCMKQGKPAFCGKDHVCYCGHKYNAHDDDEKVDVNEIYKQFRDLYEKYFGQEGYSHGFSDESHEY